MKKIKIYGLIDPRTYEIRYVGKTNRSMSERIWNHMVDKRKCHRVHWLNELRKSGMRPAYRILEYATKKNWAKKEIKWIAHGKKVGWPLTNNTSGGDGVPDLPPETRARMRLVWLGRKHKPETIELYRRTRKGRRNSEASKKKMRKIMRGRKITWVDKIAATNRKFNKQQVEEITARFKNGETCISLANEFGVNRYTMYVVVNGTYFLSHKERCKAGRNSRARA